MIDIDKLIMEARKEQKKKKLQAYQNVKAELQVAMKAKNAKVFNEQSQLEVINKYAKKLQDAISTFLEANRQDLAAEYREELSIVQKLLPKPVTRSEINDFIVSDENFSTQFFTAYINDENKEIIGIMKKNMGNAIKAVKTKFPTADGKLISDIIKSLLI